MRKLMLACAIAAAAFSASPAMALDLTAPELQAQSFTPLDAMTVGMEAFAPAPEAFVMPTATNATLMYKYATIPLALVDAVPSTPLTAGIDKLGHRAAIAAEVSGWPSI